MCTHSLTHPLTHNNSLIHHTRTHSHPPTHRLMTDMPRFLRALQQTLKYGNPTDVWMNAEKIPNGRYLMKEEQLTHSFITRLLIF